MDRKRFIELIGKYEEDWISDQEYKELISLLGNSDSVQDLNKILDRYWDQGSFEKPALIAKTGKSSKKKSSIVKIWGGIAASIALVIGLYFLIVGKADFLQGQQELVYRTGFGEKLDIELDDGSQVTLNANSVLRWTEDWQDNKGRQVVLEGEAFFEVKRQDGIPFTVVTDDVAVEVLGTSFNVDSRESSTRVYLDEGKVNLKLKEIIADPAQEGSAEMKKNNEILLQPGEQVKYSAREKRVEKSEGLSMITGAAWKLDVLNFKNMQFHEVLDLLRDTYGQSFECSDGKLLSTPMYLGVPYSNWDAVRQALELSLNVKFEKVSDRRYRVKTDGKEKIKHINKDLKK